MATTDDYLAQAEKCEREAAVQSNPIIKEQLLDLAADLRCLADLYKLPSEKDRDAAASNRKLN